MDCLKIFENEYARGCYYEQIKAAEIKWLKTAIPSDVYKDAFKKAIEFTENRPFVNYISDAVLQGVISPDDRKWFQDVIVPQAVKQGLKHGAVIIKRDAFKKYYMNAILKFLNRKSPIEMKIFYEYDKAIEWLKSFPF